MCYNNRNAVFVVDFFVVHTHMTDLAQPRCACAKIAAAIELSLPGRGRQNPFLKGKNMKKHKTRRKNTYAALALALALAALLLDSRCRPVTTRCALASARLPASFDGFTIVQLSDVHGALFGKDNSRLLARVQREDPDVIALTGDLADEFTDMEVVDSLLGALAEIAPVYYVSGNHEWASGLLPELEGLFEQHGVTYLRNECVTLGRGGESIVLAGVEDPNGWRDMSEPDEIVEMIRENHGDAFTVLLGHRNYWAEEYPDLPVDLILCGHAHGGIIRLPLIGGVLGTGRVLFPDWVDGVHEVGRYTLIISRGIGQSPAAPRFLNNPEVVAVTLRSTEK